MTIKTRRRHTVCLRLGAAIVATVAVLAGGVGAEAQSAEELIPFKKLKAGTRREVWKICKTWTVRRKVDERRVACSPETYAWLLARLPLAALVLRELELGDYAISADEDGHIAVDDKSGAFAKCEPIHRDAGRLVLLARGVIDGPLHPPVKGRAVIVIRWRESKKAAADASGAAQIVSDCFIYFRLDDGVLHKATRPFRKVLARSMQSKLDPIVTCAAKVAALVESRPRAVARALVSGKARPETIKAFRRRFPAAREPARESDREPAGEPAGKSAESR